MAKAEMAKQEMERHHKKNTLDRSLAAAAERRECCLGSVVEKARADLARVQSAHKAKARAAVEAVAELAMSRRGKYLPFFLFFLYVVWLGGSVFGEHTVWGVSSEWVILKIELYGIYTSTRRRANMLGARK